MNRKRNLTVVPLPFNTTPPSEKKKSSSNDENSAEKVSRVIRRSHSTVTPHRFNTTLTHVPTPLPSSNFFLKRRGSRGSIAISHSSGSKKTKSDGSVGSIEFVSSDSKSSTFSGCAKKRKKRKKTQNIMKLVRSTVTLLLFVSLLIGIFVFGLISSIIVGSYYRVAQNTIDVQNISKMLERSLHHAEGHMNLMGSLGSLKELICNGSNPSSMNALFSNFVSKYPSSGFEKYLVVESNGNLLVDVEKNPDGVPIILTTSKSLSNEHFHEEYLTRKNSTKLFFGHWRTISSLNDDRVLNVNNTEEYNSLIEFQKNIFCKNGSSSGYIIGYKRVYELDEMHSSFLLGQSASYIHVHDSHGDFIFFAGDVNQELKSNDESSKFDLLYGTYVRNNIALGYNRFSVYLYNFNCAPFTILGNVFYTCATFSSFEGILSSPSSLITCCICIVLLIIGYLLSYIRAKSIMKERKKFSVLCEKIYPLPIAERILKKSIFIAEEKKNVGIIFADMVKFSSWSKQLTAQELIFFLGEAFTAVDYLATQFGVYKVKLIGDCYFGICGLEEHTTKNNNAHVADLVKFASTIIQHFQDYYIDVNPSLSLKCPKFRIGVHSGKIIAGVLHRSIPFFDCYSKAVNLASRMEQHGKEDFVHTTFTVKEQLSGYDCFKFKSRGFSKPKGFEKMETFFVSWTEDYDSNTVYNNREIS